MLWRWIIRPLVAILVGAGAVKSGDEHPGAAFVAAIISLLLFVLLVMDVINKIKGMTG